MSMKADYRVILTDDEGCSHQRDYINWIGAMSAVKNLATLVLQITVMEISAETMDGVTDGIIRNANGAMIADYTVFKI